MVESLRSRKMSAEDVPAVLAIERESFSLPWTRQMFEEELRQGLSWHRVAESERREVVGFLIGRIYPDAWHLMDLAVASWGRRRGVATRLLGDFLRAADAAGLPVFLEVRPRNVEALALYEGWGFTTGGHAQELLLRHG